MSHRCSEIFLTMPRLGQRKSERPGAQKSRLTGSVVIGKAIFQDGDPAQNDDRRTAREAGEERHIQNVRGPVRDLKCHRRVRSHPAVIQECGIQRGFSGSGYRCLFRVLASSSIAVRCFRRRRQNALHIEIALTLFPRATCVNLYQGIVGLVVKSGLKTYSECELKL